MSRLAVSQREHLSDLSKNSEWVCIQAETSDDVAERQEMKSQIEATASKLGIAVHQQASIEPGRDLQTSRGRLNKRARSNAVAWDETDSSRKHRRTTTARTGPSVLAPSPTRQSTRDCHHETINTEQLSPPRRTAGSQMSLRQNPKKTSQFRGAIEQASPHTSRNTVRCTTDAPTQSSLSQMVSPFLFERRKGPVLDLKTKEAYTTVLTGFEPPDDEAVHLTLRGYDQDALETRFLTVLIIPLRLFFRFWTPGNSDGDSDRGFVARKYLYSNAMWPEPPSTRQIE